MVGRSKPTHGYGNREVDMDLAAVDSVGVDGVGSGNVIAILDMGDSFTSQSAIFFRGNPRFGMQYDLLHGSTTAFIFPFGGYGVSGNQGSSSSWWHDSGFKVFR